MRSKILFFTIALLFFTCYAVTTFAGEEAKKPQLYIVWDISVNPSMVGEFEAVSKEELALYAKHEFPLSWTTYSTRDFHYYYTMKVENFAAIDELHKTFGKMKEKIGDQYQELMDRYAGTFEYVQTQIYKYLPELSYIPENPRLKKEELKFFRMNFLYIEAGKEKKVEEIAKKWASLSKSKNVPDPYFFYAAAMGVEMPLFVVIEGAKSPSDFFAHLEKRKDLLGKEGEQLWKEALSTMRKGEEKIGWARPDLSYAPKKD